MKKVLVVAAIAAVLVAGGTLVGHSKNVADGVVTPSSDPGDGVRPAN